ncbi:MAG TPA: 2,4'-dihydroxyacetophenone dioxygenase family protein [Candidatus Dormibacteraeota bacterium]|nr:2,4'-dihydroxyacetophenone dioxygenase family protein [Candidatus Dormibacteraeota bacterium]
MATTPSAIPTFKPTYLGAGDLPWHPFTPYSEEVMLKILHLDLVRGETVLLLKAPGGTNLGVHNHYGRVLVYTVQGTWSYAEHDWTSRAGDFVYEVANSRHTFQAQPGEDVVVFIVLEGALAFLDENGNTVAVETAHTVAERYEAYCRANGIPAVDLTQFSLT